MDKPRSNTKATEFQRQDWRTLIKYFILWKVLLLTVAWTSPGPGYDTSTQILFDQYEEYEQPAKTVLGRGIEHLVLRLTRWDGIYFSSSAAHGHVNEQNWAFSWSLAKCISFISRVLFSSLSLPLVVKNALSGILISTFSHLLAVFALYQLTYNVIPSTHATKCRVAFVASCLHILSPAGLFLSAPYGESTFAMLDFAGTLSYTLATRTRLQQDAPTNVAAMWTLLAGLCFGAATMVRSNGILSGMLFAWDATQAFLQPVQLIRDPKALTKFAATVCAGLLLAIGFAAPQVVAYMEYCTGGNSRPWCTKLLPSIYSWVQDHYWEVGFMRYWTLNNLPLFLLAGPMLVILIYTGFMSEHQVVPSYPQRPEDHLEHNQKRNINKAVMEARIYNHIMPRLGLEQILLAVMAATSFHVQIINRISSGCPVWYIVLASAICSSTDSGDVSRRANLIRNVGILSQRKYLQWIVRGMVMYAVVQGGLYASFLPPA